MKESKFDGGVLGMIGWTIVTSLLGSITLGLAEPWCICIWIKWFAKHSVIDGKRIEFDGNGAQLFGNWIKWFLLTIITLGIYSLWIPIKVCKWTVKHVHFVDAEPAPAEQAA